LGALAGLVVRYINNIGHFISFLVSLFPVQSFQ